MNFFKCLNLKGRPLLFTAFCYMATIIGAAIYALGIQLFYRPVQLVSGGLTGISMIINLLTDLPVGVMVIIMNLPIFAFALKRFGIKYLMGSIIGMVFSSVFIDLFSHYIHIVLTNDPMLSALYGGLVSGLGCGIMYFVGSSSGGIDVIAKFIKEKYPYVNFGSFILLLNAFIVVVYTIIFRSYDKSMYTVIAVAVSAKIIDMVLYGFSTSKLCYIISEHSDEIKGEIVKTLHRGVTMINGKGAYSGQNKQVLLCVVKRQQIIEIRRLIRNIDQQAFVIVSDARDVFGKGFGNISDEK